METNNFNSTVNSNSTYNQEAIQNTPQNIDWDGIHWIDRKPSHPERIITIGTSCSGIGAPEQALQQLGLKTKIMFAGDIDSNVRKSYFANYPITEEQWHNDLRAFDASPYKDKISILICGVCCQPFSKAGKQEGTEDEEKGCLAKKMRDVIRECQPKVWIMENVDNMLTCGNGKHWKIIKKWFDETGYDIHYQVLNALDYGLPQNRNRLFVIGFKNPNPDFKFPAPVELKKCIRDYLIDTTPAFRRLYPREALNLQGFSGDFKMVVPDYAIYHQAGNSIAVPVLRAIFSQIDLTKYGFDPEELGMEVEEPVDLKEISPIVDDMNEDKEIMAHAYMTIADFNSEIAKLKSEIEEKKTRLDKLVSQLESRKEGAINNWKLHMKQLKEDEQMLIELGIDPTSLQMPDEIIQEGYEKNGSETPSTEECAFGEIEIEKVDEYDVEKPLLTPFYKLLGIETIRGVTAMKEEIIDTGINPVTGKKRQSRQHIPFYMLCNHTPLTVQLKMGNMKHKPTYPDPDETRVVSADGCSPTLTYTHSDFLIWVGKRYCECEEGISDLTTEIA